MFATLVIFSVTSVVGFVFMSSVLLSPLLKSSISILSLSIFLIAELCPFLLGMSLLNVLLEIGISTVKPCARVPNSPLSCTDGRNS